MESTATTHTHTAGRDRGRDAAKPGLALVLALLSIPGSTVAWYLLPLGGLLIGLPLGVAAIVLGRRARQRLGGSRMATAAIVIAVLAIGQMAIYYSIESLA
jgi:hypothetical protein